MDWSKGISARYILTRVDPETWRDVETREIKSGSIDRTAENLCESASIVVPEIEQTKEIYLRIYLDARQEGDAGERVPLFTGLTGAPEKELEVGDPTYTVELYSVLKPADDVLLQKGWYAPVGISGGILIRELLKGNAPIEVSDDAPPLTSSIVAEDGESCLSMAWKIADAMNWRIRPDGMGVIYVEPIPTETAVTFDAQEYDVIETKVTEKRDWFSCPNVYRAVVDDAVAVARDDSEESELSTVNRGREVWQEDADVSLSDDESLSDYALRALKEAQSYAKTLSYDRRFVPDVGVGDIVQINYPKQEIGGTYRVTSQSIELGYACKTSEEVKSE